MKWLLKILRRMAAYAGKAEAQSFETALRAVRRGRGLEDPSSEEACGWYAFLSTVEARLLPVDRVQYAPKAGAFAAPPHFRSPMSVSGVVVANRRLDMAVKNGGVVVTVSDIGGQLICELMLPAAGGAELQMPTLPPGLAEEVRGRILTGWDDLGEWPEDASQPAPAPQEAVAQETEESYW